MTDVLVTGAAGFIGFHAALRLLDEGRSVVGVDSLTPYYEPSLKRARLSRLEAYPRFRFEHLDLADRAAMDDRITDLKAPRILHLAAQAGVRYSVENPAAFVDSNLIGFANVLELARRAHAEHLVFASSSSVYGATVETPFHTSDDTSHPLSLYAASKKANEVMAHAYAYLFNVPMTGLRFFTVYGPWGRPDMATHAFVRKLFAGEPIDVYAGGTVSRDFTFVDDVVEAVVRVLDCAPAPNPAWAGPTRDPAGSSAPFRVYNVGNRTPVSVNRLLEILERETGRTAIRREVPLPAADVPLTCADVSDLERDMSVSPSTPLEVGLARLVEWYREYYRPG